MAVYTSVSEAELAGFLEGYDLGRVERFTGIKEGVENTNYRLTTDAGDYILTLYEKRVKQEDLPFFIEVMEVLCKAGLNCPHPVKDRQGEVVGMLNGRPGAIFTFLEGSWSADPNPARCEALGRTLARLHNGCAGVNLGRANSLGPSSWKALLQRAKASSNHGLNPNHEAYVSLARQDKSGVPEKLEQLLDRLVDEWPEGLPRGVIHADLFPNNALFKGDELTGVIDFYFACEDFYAYDLAICLNSWCFDAAGVFDKEKCSAMIAGYQGLRKLDPAELDAMPLLATGAAMRFFLTRLYDWVNTPAGALVSPKDPAEYSNIVQYWETQKSWRTLVGDMSFGESIVP